MAYADDYRTLRRVMLRELVAPGCTACACLSPELGRPKDTASDEWWRSDRYGSLAATATGAGAELVVQAATVVARPCARAAVEHRRGSGDRLWAARKSSGGSIGPWTKRRNSMWDRDGWNDVLQLHSDEHLPLRDGGLGGRHCDERSGRNALACVCLARGVAKIARSGRNAFDLCVLTKIASGAWRCQA